MVKFRLFQSPRKDKGEKVESLARLNAKHEPTAKQSRGEVVPSSMQMVKQFVAALNRHASVKELLCFFKSNKVKIVFEDGMEVSAEKFCNMTQKLFASFPDFDWECPIPLEEIRPGYILVDEVRSSGTHTGAPFGFGRLPEIPAAGKRCENDAARWYFTMLNNKIVGGEVVALGVNCGPEGTYQLLRGDT